VEGFGKKVSGFLSNDCRLSRRVAPSSSQIVPQSKAIDNASLHGIYKLSHSWITVTTTVTTNIPKRVLKGILVQRNLKPASFTDLHICWTEIMLISHPFCDGENLEKVRLPSLRKIQLFITILAFVQ
jgi:hypothetical protein